jgi:hypothetical protein
MLRNRLRVHLAERQGRYKVPVHHIHVQEVHLSFKDGQHGFQIGHIGGKDGRRKKHGILKL